MWTPQILAYQKDDVQYIIMTLVCCRIMRRYISYRRHHVLLLVLMIMMLPWFDTWKVTAAASETQVIDNERPTRTGAQLHMLTKRFCI